MNPPVLLTLDEVLEIHALQVELFGGDPGVLNMGLMESGVAQPSFSFSGQFVHEDLAAMAAAYLFHIGKNHPFADGNKRTATHAAMTFLRLNGVKLTFPVDESEDVVLAVMEGQTTKEQLAEWFRGLMRTA
jgi:death on curing protein